MNAICEAPVSCRVLKLQMNLAGAKLPSFNIPEVPNSILTSRISGSSIGYFGGEDRGRIVDEEIA